PTSVQTTDLILSGVSGASVSGVTVLSGNTTARFTINVPVEGTLSADIPPGAINDAFGNPGAAFTASYPIDVGTEPFPGTLTATTPLGSLVYSASTAGMVNFT